MRLVYQTCPLHDIGKVGIPDAILQKPGRLTPEEFEIMKRHVTIGADAIRATLEHSPSASFLQFALDIAQSHHEKFDGTGYPHRLKGNQIPLAARIVALADVYDALTTKRVYKDAFPHSKADAIIAEGSGKHFDPVIVQAYRRAEVDFDTIRITLGDNEPKAPLGLPPGQAIRCAPIAAPWPGNLPTITPATTNY
jgi:putative two-component system response regulator